ncbi:MAG: DUF885 domain-containing protein [Rheinheimera sp.]
MKQTLWVLVFCATLTACASHKVDPDQSFDALANRIWQDAENIGRTNNNELPDMSPEAYLKANQQFKQLLAELNAVDVQSLSEQHQINHTILRYRLQNQVDEYTYGDRYMPLTAESGFHSDILFQLSGNQFKTAEDVEKYLTKLSSLPRYMAQQTAWMRQGIAKGYTQPKAVLAGYEQGILSFIQKDIEKSVFFRPLRKAVSTIPADQWQTLQQRARTIITEQIHPAYQQYYDFFVGEYLPAARDTIAASALPDGANFYQNRLEYYTTLKMTPAEVHQIGLNEVARIRAEMATVIAQTGFQGSFAEFIQFLRTDKQFYATTPDQLLREAAFLSKKIDAQLPKLFHTLPRTPYGVEAVPAEIAPKYTTGRYSGGREPGDAGFYWVNTYALDRRPLYEMEALTLHEAVPGHHLQVALANEQTNLPSYRRSFYTSAFGEGWGLYAEYLGLEVGFYQDPYSNFGRLTYEMWRACRLVVDTGMHTMGWSRQQAIDFLASNTALSMHNVTTEVDRYISWPAQALSYKLGEITIKRLRADAEQALGDKFDVRQFHDVVLQNGSLPLPVLEQQVAKYIRQQQSK